MVAWKAKEARRVLVGRVFFLARVGWMVPKYRYVGIGFSLPVSASANASTSDEWVEDSIFYRRDNSVASGTR